MGFTAVTITQLSIEKVSKTLSLFHFWLAQISLVGLVIGLSLVYSGSPEFEPIAAISAMGYATSFLLFAGVAWPVLRGR